jgi:hypothetical protein
MLASQYFPPGRYSPDSPVVDWEVDCAIEQQSKVVLTASIDDGSEAPAFASHTGRTATLVALRMDAQVAMELHAKLSDLGRSRGWLSAAAG